jgi:heme exporter protein A
MLLHANNIACERDERCLFKQLNLRVKVGDIWHIKGSNGAGKSSLLRQLVGLLPIDVGSVDWGCGTDQVLYIGHQLALKQQLTANENLTWLMAVTCGSTQQQRYEALYKVGLGDFADTLVAQLSAGQRRRLALARLHLTAAKMWLLDEPFTAMDQQGIADVQAWFVAHITAGGAIVLISHQDLTIGGVKTLALADFKETAAC